MFNSATNIEEVLIQVNKFINIDKDRQAYTKHFNALCVELFALLKQDSQFKSLFNGLQLGGSYGDNLKVKRADEFDLVFHIGLPERDLVIVKKDTKMPGNVIIDLTKVFEKLKLDKQRKEIYQLLRSWVIPNSNLLTVNKFQSWLQGCFQKAMNRMGGQINVDGNVSALQYRRMGPAHTIFITGKYKYSVDFVPGILLSANKSILPKKLKGATNWEAIPKPQFGVNGDQISFRASYYLHENAMIRNNKNFKNAIRMMKKFRDTHQNMSKLKSYFIKTLFLWKLHNTADKAYWQSPLNLIVIDMFTELETSLFKENLPFFWDPNLNMYKDLCKVQKLEMLNCVTNAKSTLMNAAKKFTPLLKYQTYCIFINKEEIQIAGIESPSKVA